VKKIKWLLLLTMLAVCAFAVSLLAGRIHGGNSPGANFALVRPSFVDVAYAEGAASEAAISTVVYEAVISAYIQTSAINLNLIRSQFRTIESETPQYIIGSVAVPGYPEIFDVHVFAHVDGWILAYYLNDDVTSKIADVAASRIDTTILEIVLQIVAGAAGVPALNITYYDFRFPNATNVLLVAEDNINGNDFSIELPNEYAYFERSWATARYHVFLVDGTQAEIVFLDYGFVFGPVSPSLLTVGMPHSIEIAECCNAFGVLAITYRVP
jgi:hypothetical protein